jgi:AraC family transcriptional regulator
VSSKYDRQQTCKETLIFLDPKVVAHAFHESIDPDKVEILPHFSQSNPTIDTLAETLEDCLALGQLNLMDAESGAITLKLHLIRTHGNKKIKSPAKRIDCLSSSEIKTIGDYLNTHIHENMSLTTMAGLVMKSTGHFSRCFVGSFGQSPCEYLKSMRLNRAMQIIEKNPSLSVKQVASTVGFSSTHLKRLLRHKFGVSAIDHRLL